MTVSGAAPPGVSGRLLQAATLPVQVPPNASPSWSSDHRLAFTTRRGVYVLELLPDASQPPHSLTMEKTFLPNPTQPNPHQAVGVTEEMVGPEEVMDRVVAPGAAGGEVGTCHHIREVDKLFPAQLPAVQGGGLEPLHPSTLLRPLLHLHLPADHPDRRLQTVPAPAGG